MTTVTNTNAVLLLKRPGGAFEPRAYQTRQARFLFGQTEFKTVRHGTTAWTLHLARFAGRLLRDWPVNSGNTDSTICGKVLATRKPILLLRLSGLLLLREADRTSDA